MAFESALCVDPRKLYHEQCCAMQAVLTLLLVRDQAYAFIFTAVWFILCMWRAHPELQASVQRTLLKSCGGAAMSWSQRGQWVT